MLLSVPQWILRKDGVLHEQLAVDQGLTRVSWGYLFTV